MASNPDCNIKCECTCCCPNCCEGGDGGPLCCLSFGVVALMLPLLFCDLYFANFSISCQHDMSRIGFDLSFWLVIMGYTSLTLYLLMFITMICRSECILCISLCINGLYYPFTYAWLIIGCIIFWRYVEPEGNCSADISNYMWSRLIIGLVLSFFSIPFGFTVAADAAMG